MLIKSSHIVLDTCCILNFCASGNFLSILKTIPAQVVVTEVVKERELLTLRRLENQENEDATQLERAIEQELLFVVDFESEAEEETFINYAFELGDDGESATCAIAVHREYAMATDDKKAITFCKKEALNLQIFSTLEIIKYWSESANINPEKLRTVLDNINVKGRYIPHRNHPLLSWWETATIR
ncbi:conserved hypothetical protein [Planktothrix serta PCC 8927]|uniref:PIN domain-containing protein n=1 Tax=Planktothrix serta PCC 8927 TaxID=671068 RepID=A0A7Z9BSN7_9CYAN|nr:hypothetical protein [Planktothrix serta]VXD22021.1 conserved hypothetical protein [Planktothrix serta PCC 8927]